MTSSPNDPKPKRTSVFSSWRDASTFLIFFFLASVVLIIIGTFVAKLLWTVIK